MMLGRMLRLDDGTVIEIAGRPAQGTRHSVLFGVDRASGDDVVVKIELVEGALATERRALEWIGAQKGPVPRVRRASTLRLPDGRHSVCLVIDRARGTAPDTDAAWRKMGRTLALLDAVPWHGSGLGVFESDEFTAAHVERIRDLAGPLRDAMTGVEDWDQIATSPLPGKPPLVITHGDPGPGNYLDGSPAGILIDWEEASVAPRGLDISRAMFIALLGAGPENFVARDHAARSRAVAAGYLQRLDDAWQPDVGELRWWLTVAGIQFAHRRWRRAGRPGVLPWSDAICVLATALLNNDWQPTCRAAPNGSR